MAARCPHGFCLSAVVCSFGCGGTAGRSRHGVIEPRSLLAPKPSVAKAKRITWPRGKLIGEGLAKTVPSYSMNARERGARG